MSDSSTPVPLSVSEARSWIGHGVDEAGGGSVGEVQRLFVDAESGEPTWLIAKLGRFRGTLVAIPPGDCAAGGARVWVAHGRDAIRTAPVVDPTRPLLREHELTICAHFGIGERVGRAAALAGRPGGTVTSRPE
jgi:hypothetical protein